MRALVTGATKGIGIETCKVLADAGEGVEAVPDGARGIGDGAFDSGAEGIPGQKRLT